MQKIWYKNSRKNIAKLGEQGKEITKKIGKKSYQVGIQQRYYMDGTTRDLTRSIGDNWKGIERNKRERKKKDQKELIKKRNKKKSRKE